MSCADRVDDPLNSRCSRKVRDAHQLGGFVTVADPDPCPDRDRSRPGHGLGDDPKAAVESRDSDRRAVLRRRCESFRLADRHRRPRPPRPRPRPPPPPPERLRGLGTEITELVGEVGIEGGLERDRFTVTGRFGRGVVGCFGGVATGGFGPLPTGLSEILPFGSTSSTTTWTS